MKSKRFKKDRQYFGSGRPSYLESLQIIDIEEKMEGFYLKKKKNKTEDSEILKNLLEYFLVDKKIPILKLVNSIEKEIIILSLSRFDGNQRKTARFLGLKANTLNFKIKKHGIEFRKVTG